MPAHRSPSHQLWEMCWDRQCHAYTLCGEAQRLHGGAYIAEIVRRVPSMRAQIVLAMNGGLWDDADMPVPSSHARLLLARGLA